MGTEKAYVNRELLSTYDHRHFGGRSGEYILAKDCAVVRGLMARHAGMLLDIPCGTGVYAQQFSEERYEVVGADASMQMLEMAGERVVTLPRVMCDINVLPFAEASFDAIMTIRLFQHYPKADVARMLGELRRVVKPDGLIVFDTFRWTPRSLPVVGSFLPRTTVYVWSCSDVETLIREAGLRRVTARSSYLFSPIWQRKLPLAVVKGLSALEGLLPKPWLLRTFWACSREGS
jgi:ubiquinone/menaquinone biosynthesis C-methylase UbiE